jgi:peroxin-19
MVSTIHALSQTKDDDDDIADLLNEFETPPAPPPPPTVATTSGSLTTPNGPPTIAPDIMDALSDDFASELARGMESLMRELGVPDEPTSGEDDPEESHKLLKAAWEAMLLEGLGDETGSGEASGSRNAGNKVSKDDQVSGKEDSRDTETDFQRKIRQAMDKLKESETDLKV